MSDYTRNYFHNNKKVSKNEFFRCLKNKSVSLAREYNLGEVGSIGVYDFDKRKYEAYKRKLNGYGGYVPVTLIFGSDNERFQIQKTRKHR